MSEAQSEDSRQDQAAESKGRNTTWRRRCVSLRVPIRQAFCEPERQQQDQGYEESVKRVDLSDDGLAPKGLTHSESQCSSDRRQAGGQEADVKRCKTDKAQRHQVA